MEHYLGKILLSCMLYGLVINEVSPLVAVRLTTWVNKNCYFIEKRKR